jgi:voltage-gated potassium channel
VGYGDKYPVTNPGRIVGVLIMIVGVGLFGVLTGFLANTFLAPAGEKQEKDDEGSRATSSQGQTPDEALPATVGLTAQLDQLTAEVARLRLMLDRLSASQEAGREGSPQPQDYNQGGGSG